MLHKLLRPPKSSVGFVGNLFRGGRRHKVQEADIVAPAEAETPDIPEAETVRQRKKRQPVGKHRVLLAVASLAIAIVLWLYVQVTVNPIETRTFTIPLTYEGIQDAESRGFELQYPLQSVQVHLMGRRKTVNALNNDDVRAYLDFAQVESTGLVRLEVQIDTGGLLYLRTTFKSPSAVTVSVREKETGVTNQ